jgi:hypothetical protein
VEEFSALAVPKVRLKRREQRLLTTQMRCQQALYSDEGYLLKHKEAALTPFPDFMELDDVGVVL